MKNLSILLIGLSFTMLVSTAFSQSRPDNSKTVPANQVVANEVKVTSSPELYHLAQGWVNDFSKSDPSVTISLDKIMGSEAMNIDHLTLVTDQNDKVVYDQSNWRMIIGRDVIVPIMNAKNPMLNLLYQKGISQKKFAQMFNDPSSRNWAAMVKEGQSVQMQLFIPDNKEILTVLGDFAKTSFNNNNLKLVASVNDAIAEVEKDFLAIGFCTLNDLKAYNLAAGNENIRLLPIDKNGNGRLDNFENIYRNTNEFAHGVWIGKYPSTLCNDIYAVSKSKPVNKGELSFLSFILAEGQVALGSNGFCELASSEKQSNIADLFAKGITDLKAGNTTPAPKSWPVILTLLAIGGLFVAIFFYSRRRAGNVTTEKEIQVAPFLIENAMDVPKGLYFDKTHTWAFMEQDGNVRVGIDDFLQHITGKLTKIRMKEAGEKVRKGEAIVTIIRDGKQLNIYAPISGTILAQNESLMTDSAILNSSPFFKGWVYQIEPKNWLREVQFMFMGEKYTDWLRDEFVRLKDFIAASVRTDEMVYAHVILQDGGELTDNVLADMGPEVWEDFQTRFIDTSR